MSTYGPLSGTGTQALTAGTGALHVHVDTRAVGTSIGSANPANIYHQGFIRAGDGTGWYHPVPIEADDAWLALPNGATIFGWSVLFGGVIHVTEVIGPSPLSGPTGPSGPAGPAGPSTPQTIAHQSAFLAADIAATSVSAWKDLVTLSLAAGVHFLTAKIQFRISSQWNCEGRIFDGTNTPVSGAQVERTNTDDGHLVLNGFVTLASTTTVRLQFHDGNAFATIKAALVVDNVGNNCTYLHSLQVA